MHINKGAGPPASLKTIYRMLSFTTRLIRLEDIASLETQAQSGNCAMDSGLTGSTQSFWESDDPRRESTGWDRWLGITRWSRMKWVVIFGWMRRTHEVERNQARRKKGGL